MWLIGSKSKVEQYISKVDNYNGYTGDKTATWGEPRKHPTKELYAVQKNMSVEPDSQLEEKEELPSDWQAKDPLA
jgi:hypothetical protein